MPGSYLGVREQVEGGHGAGDDWYEIFMFRFGILKKPVTEFATSMHP